MKISGPRSKPVAALTSEPKKESASVEGLRVKPLEPGRIRDGFDARPPTRAPNIRIGSGHSDNITRARHDGGTSGNGSGVKAGSSLTLLPRLRDLVPDLGVQTQGSKVRGSGHSDLVTMGNGPGRERPGRDIDAGPVPADKGNAGRSRDKREPVLTKESLEGLDLSSRMTRKLARAKSIDKVAQIIRRLPAEMQDQIMKLCRGPVRPGSGHSDNLQV